MNILTIGGAGYVGSVLCESLLAQGHAVAVVDDLSTGHRAAVPAEAHLYVGDLRGDVLDRVFAEQEIDVVIHLAALSLVAESIREPGRYFATNVGGAVHLLEAMRRHGVERIVFSSTAAVYGYPESNPITEETACRPVNPYGESKRMVETILRWYGDLHSMRWIALRYFNAAGATAAHGEDHSPESHLIPIALDVASGRRERLSVYGDDYGTADGTCVRDYVHVADLAAAHLLASERLMREREQRAFNLGTGAGHSVWEVVQMVRDVTGEEVPAEVVARRPGDPDILVASPARACSELGWTPRLSSLEDIVRSAWEWRCHHLHGYGSAAGGTS